MNITFYDLLAAAVQQNGTVAQILADIDTLKRLKAVAVKNRAKLSKAKIEKELEECDEEARAY